MEQAIITVGSSCSRKVPRHDFDWSKCLCHILEQQSGDLTAFSQTSWSTLVNAAEIRRDDVWDFL